MSDLLRWFGEQSEAVKLALIAGVTGIFGGFWAAVKELRKPVLNSQPVANVTTVTAPRAQDDPVLLLLAEVAAINAGLAELINLIRNDDETRDAITELKNEIYLLRSVLSNKTIGM